MQIMPLSVLVHKAPRKYSFLSDKRAIIVEFHFNGLNKVKCKSEGKKLIETRKLMGEVFVREIELAISQENYKRLLPFEHEAPLLDHILCNFNV